LEYHVFRFINPEEARKERKLLEKYTSNMNTPMNSNDAEDTISDFSTLSSCDKDWYYAQREKLNREGIYSNALSSAESLLEAQTNDETNSTTSSSISYKQSKYDKRNSYINNVLSNIINNYNMNKDSGSSVLSSSLKSKVSISSLNRLSDNISNKSYDPVGVSNIVMQENTFNKKRCSEDFTRFTDPSFNLFSETRNRRSHSLSYANGRQKPFNFLKHEYQKHNISTSTLDTKDYKINTQFFNGEVSPILKKSFIFKNNKVENKIENKVENKIENKIDNKNENKIDNKTDNKIDNKTDNKIDDKSDSTLINSFELTDTTEPRPRDSEELMKKYFEFWKTRKFVQLSEDISNNQKNIRNANIMSKELNMDVIYQFVVTNDIYPLPKSFWEISLEHDITNNEIKIYQDYDDLVKIKEENEKYIHSFTKDSEHYAKEYPYRVIVKVIDGKNNKIYHWSLKEFLNRLNRMKHVYESSILTNKIVYDSYDNMMDPFRENSRSSFMLIGYSKCILSSLLYSKYDINYTFRLPIVEWQTGKRKGYLTVKFLSIYDPDENESIASESSNSYLEKNSDASSNLLNDAENTLKSDNKTTNKDKNEEEEEEEEEDIDTTNNNKIQENTDDLLLSKNNIKIGTELYFDIVIEKIEGISEDEFTQIHCQFNTTDFNRKLYIHRKKKSSNKTKNNNNSNNKEKQSQRNKEFILENDNESLFSTNLKTGFKNNDILFNYSQTIHLHITKNILRNLKHGYINFEIFGSKPNGMISSLIHDLYSKENSPMNEFRAKEDQILYIIMEFMDNGDLSGLLKAHKILLKPIEEEKLYDIFIQAMKSLKYIHSQNICHRDIKPENLFITVDNIVKLGDFGVSASIVDKNEKNKNYQNINDMSIQETNADGIDVPTIKVTKENDDFFKTDNLILKPQGNEPSLKSMLFDTEEEKERYAKQHFAAVKIQNQFRQYKALVDNAVFVQTLLRTKLAKKI